MIDKEPKPNPEITVIHYIKAINKLPDISFLQKAVLITLLLYGGKIEKSGNDVKAKRPIFPSLERIAQDINSDKHTISRALHGAKSKAKTGLIKLGYISKVETSRLSNEYRLHYEKIIPEGLTENPEGLTENPEGLTENPEGLTERQRIRIEKSLNKREREEEKPAPAQTSISFEENADGFSKKKPTVKEAMEVLS